MQHKKLMREFWISWQKMTARSLFAPLFLSPSLSLSLAVATAVAAVPALQQQANATTATSWHFDPATNELIISLPEGTTPKYSLIGNSQIAVDLPNTEVAVDATQLYPEGTVRSVGVSQLQPGVARIVVNLAPGMAVKVDRTQFQRVGADNRWVLVPAIEPSTPETAETPALQPTTPNPTTTEAPSDPAPPEVATVEPNRTQQPTPDDRIRPITVPLVNLQTGEKPQRRVAPRSDRPAEPAAAAPAEPRVIPFGEPLPTPSRTSDPSGRKSAIPNNSRVPVQVATGANFILPAGTSLALVYPGPRPLRLRRQTSDPQVLLLQGGITDIRGNAIVPANTPVIGRFETSNLGSRFIAEAIQINGQNIPLAATSEPISGRRPVPRDRSVLRNGGIGGAALFLLSGLSGVGLLLGAAAGAASTYVTAPQPATVQPGQIVEIQLTEDLPQYSF
ncbi:MAG: AMIN domain-containing protein [Microcoleus sp.]